MSRAETLFTQSTMNEFGQIVGYWMTCTQSLCEIKSDMEAVARRYESTSQSGPTAFYTDNCCKDRRILSEAFPSLTNGVQDHHRKDLAFEGKIVVAKDLDDVNYLVSIFETSETITFGFDIEWNVTFVEGAPQPKAAILQVYTDEPILDGKGLCVVFQLCHLSLFPDSLKQWLENDQYSKVGVCTKADATKLFKDYGCQVNGVHDVAAFIARNLPSTT